MENPKNKKISDQLINQLSAGGFADLPQDVESWTDEEWFNLQKKLENILSNRRLSSEEVEDIVSETLTTFWKIRDVPKENRIYSAVRILHYKWLSFTKKLSKQKQQVQIDDENRPELGSAVENPEKILMNREKTIDYQKCAGKCLQKMPPHKRHLFVTCKKLEYGNLKRKAIADYLEVTVETLNKRVSRIVKDLRECGIECMRAKGYGDYEIPIG